jgi:hypothetical protein
MTKGGTKHMSKIDCKQIAYYGKPIDTLTRDELISALEELAGAIHDCTVGNKRCSEILKIRTEVQCEDD